MKIQAVLTSAAHALKLELQRRLAEPPHKAGIQINELSYSFVKETVHWFILTETTSVAVLHLCDICLLSNFLLLGFSDDDHAPLSFLEMGEAWPPFNIFSFSLRF